MARGFLGILLIIFSIIFSYILTYTDFQRMLQLKEKLEDLNQAYKVKVDYFNKINEDYSKINKNQKAVDSIEVAIPDKFAPIYDFNIIYELASSNGLSIEDISFEKPETFSFEKKEDINDRRRIQSQPEEEKEIVSVYGLEIEKPKLLRSKMSITVSGDYAKEFITENNNSESKIFGIKKFIKDLEKNARIFSFSNMKIERFEVSFIENEEQVTEEKVKAILDFYVYTYQSI